jgi:hypothetical protein
MHSDVRIIDTLFEMQPSHYAYTCVQLYTQARVYGRMMLAPWLPVLNRNGESASNSTSSIAKVLLERLIHDAEWLLLAATACALVCVALLRRARHRQRQQQQLRTAAVSQAPTVGVTAVTADTTVATATATAAAAEDTTQVAVSGSTGAAATTGIYSTNRNSDEASES